jgi:glycosyltransferase involved in cell wall biosynthesis
MSKSLDVPELCVKGVVLDQPDLSVSETCLLPLVSVIVTNFNNQDYIEEAIKSVKRQTYPMVECIVVDDASTDRSRAVLLELQARQGGFRVILRVSNGGQTAAALEGLAESKGMFVHFLDGDDFVSPCFIETHVAVHLSLRRAAGFSCSDMGQVFRGQQIASGDSNIARFIASTGKKKALTRANANVEVLAALGLRSVPGDRIFEVPPWYKDWPWSATSAVLFRRNALDLFADACDAENIKRSMDAFFCRGINAVAGSVIVDMSLGGYRLHDTNTHNLRLPLDYTISFDRLKTIETTESILDCIIHHIVMKCDRFERIFWSKQSYFELLANITRLYPKRLVSPRVIAIRNFRRLARVFGVAQILFWLVGMHQVSDWFKRRVSTNSTVPLDS